MASGKRITGDIMAQAQKLGLFDVLKRLLRQGEKIDDISIDTLRAAARKSDVDLPTKTPINSGYAGQQYPLPDDLAQKYPGGVRFDADGYPDFGPHATHDVQIDMKGNRSYGPNGDFGAANEAAGFPRNQRHPDHTWHHHQDRSTMQLVPRDLHDEIRHSGGVSAIKELGELGE